MTLINRHHVIGGIKSHVVSIHEQHLYDVNFSALTTDETELLIDFRPVEFSEKNPPRPQLPAEDLLKVAQQKGDKKFGIILSGASDYHFFADSLDTLLPYLDVVVIDFHGFRDGRGYSLAQEIRQSPSFHEGLSLRATGDILPDTLQLLAEVGFTEFEIDNEDFNPEWFDYFTRIEHRYTGRSVGQLPIFARV